MAKVKQPLEENGIHRAKMWEIMMYALNNTSTNTYMVVVGYISYFLSSVWHPCWPVLLLPSCVSGTVSPTRSLV